MIFEMALMTVGVLALLMIIPLADQADQLGPDTAQALGSLAVDANETAYQIGQLSLAFGCLFLCALLFRSGLVPTWLAGLGLVGYALHMVGSGAKLFGAPISLVLLDPRWHLRGHARDLAAREGLQPGGVRTRRSTVWTTAGQRVHCGGHERPGRAG